MKIITKSNLFRLAALFFIWRILLFFVAFITPQFITQFKTSFPYYKEVLIDSGLPHFLWSFGNFDGVHYLRIAQDGYAYQYTQAFFPLYPILVNLFSHVTFGNYLLSALFISNIAFFLGLILFFVLVKKNFNEKIAMWSSVFLLSFPTSFFFGSVYTEGIFFFLIVWAFYLYDEGKIMQASIIGIFTSLSRLIGIFMAPALFYSKKKINYWPLFIVPFGLLSYMIFLHINFNNPFYFLTAQSVWGQERSTTELILLPQVFFRYIKILLTTNGILFVNALFELSITIFSLLLLIRITKRVNIQWLIFSYLAILTPTLTGTLTSMPRYVLIIFPIFISLALIKSQIIKISVVSISIILLIISTALFTQGYWVA